MMMSAEEEFLVYVSSARGRSGWRKSCGTSSPRATSDWTRDSRSVSGRRTVVVWAS
jgi:hypothetical protein